MSYTNLHAMHEAGVLTLTLDRPKANAFDFVMIEELLGALRNAKRDPGLRCLVLTGAGRFFSSGQDVAKILEEGPEVPYRAHLQRTYNAIVLALRNLEVPVIGAINGTAAGAGLGIALATDIRWAAASAQFIYGFSAIGLAADSGVSLTLPLHVGLAKASEMAFTNQALDAAEALEWGLVSRVLPDEQLLPSVGDLAQKIAAGATRALGLTKRAFNRAYLSNLEQVLDYEAHLQQVAGETRDHQEGLQAFLAKRAPEFEGK
ncbi:MAG: enoyl-CoA hydratase-related protein [Anaerolineales bacterium]|jgi:2-(1,2-epoxy-1,2-dihydrophenyl)acetyl-CoA isomerase